MTERNHVHTVIALAIVVVWPSLTHVFHGFDYAIGWTGGTLVAGVILHREWFLRKR